MEKKELYLSFINCVSTLMIEKDVYLIRWYGPFKDRIELKEWEYNEKANDCFFLYLFQAKKKGKQKYDYYCGMTYHRKNTIACVANRMKDANHHIHTYERENPKSISIWVGTIANKNAVSYNSVHFCELALINDLSTFEVDDDHIVNRKDKTLEGNNVYIINEWFDTHDNKYKKRPGGSIAIPNKIPDVIVYNDDEKRYTYARRLKYRR